MFAYVDETGNTGANIFDPNQPDFFTAALITKTDFDRKCRRVIGLLSTELGHDYLHAAQLGHESIELIAPRLLKILKRMDARFFLSRVEKKYLLATKVYDTFFDSGENAAVPWSAYNVRPLRLILTFKVAMLLTDEIAAEFWEMLMERNVRKARAKLPDICRTLAARVHLLPDQRSRTVIAEALEWAAVNPEALHIQSNGRMARNGHLPNMVAFTNLLDGLEHISKRWDRRVRQIKHDRQSQFESVLREWHRLYSNALPEPIHLPGETLVLQKVVESAFAVTASSASPGIQVIDLVLWLYLQLTRGRPIAPSSAMLMQFVSKRALMHDFSFRGVSEQVQERFGSILETPLSPEKMAEAQEMHRREEAARQASMAQYGEDGIVPHERKPIQSSRN